MSGIASYLKQLRKQSSKGVSQVCLEAGISTPYLYQIEDGRRNPSAKILSKLAHVYKVRPEELLREADLIPDAVIVSMPAESREQKIARAFDFVMRDPNVRAGSDAMLSLPVEAKLAIVRLYERAEGLKVLPDDVA